MADGVEDIILGTDIGDDFEFSDFAPGDYPFPARVTSQSDVDDFLGNYRNKLAGEGYRSPTEIAIELSDKWAGFPSDITRLIQHVLDHNIENVIFLSGDTHTSGLDNGQNSIFPELMAGGLDRTNGQILPLFEQFGIYIWNRGGHSSSLQPEDFGNAYGRIIVFGADSVVLEAVAEDGMVLGRHTVEKGFLPASVGATVAPLALDFGEVKQHLIYCPFQTL